MPLSEKRITPDDLLPLDHYIAKRKEYRVEAVALKKNRRMGVGPHVTFYFENYTTMWHQIQEMLYIEKGGDEQIADELSAYNPLIPQGSELVATMMIEIPDEVQRARTLAQLGGIEETITLTMGDHTVNAVPEDDQDRTTEDGKTSSVHFLHFSFDEAAKVAFKDTDTRAILTIDREGYQHMAIVPDTVRAALIKDLD